MTTNLRAQALEILRDENLTADEVASRLGANILSVRPRVSELHRRGLIEATAEERPSAIGNPASVWTATVKGKFACARADAERAFDTLNRPMEPMYDGALLRFVRRLVGRRANGARGLPTHAWW